MIVHIVIILSFQLIKKKIFLYYLKNHAALLLLLFVGSRVKDSADGVIEDLLETLLGKGRALQIFKRVDLLRLGETLLVGDRAALVLLHELIGGLLIVTEIELCADKNEGDVGAVVSNLRVPLGGDVLDYKKNNNKL